MEQARVDAARPEHHVAKAADAQFVASAGVAAITAWLGAWNQRSAAQIQDSGIGRRAEIYSGKRV